MSQSLLLAHRIYRQDADAAADLHQVLDGFDVVECRHHSDARSRRPQLVVHQTAGRDVVREADKRQPVELTQPDHLLPRQRMFRGADEDHFFFGKRHDFQIALGRGAGDDPDIQRARSNIVIDFVRLLVFQMDVDARVGGEKRLQPRRQGVQADRVDRRHPHRAGNLIGQLAHLARPAPSRAAAASRAPRYSASPAAVAVTRPRPCPRSSNVCPYSRSSARSRWLTADCEMKFFSAAREKLPVSTRSVKSCKTV